MANGSPIRCHYDLDTSNGTMELQFRLKKIEDFLAKSKKITRIEEFPISLSDPDWIPCLHDAFTGNQ